jgi:tetratricopeptide (TPR) repeat protein
LYGAQRGTSRDVTAFGNCGGTICAGLLVCSLNASALSATNTASASSMARSPDDKNAAFSIAIQLVQQIQSQQQSILNELNETRRQNSAILKAAHRVTILLAGLLVLVLAGVGLMLVRVVRAAGVREIAVAASRPVSEAVRAAHVDLLLAKGDALLDLKQPAQALVCYEQALALDEHSTEASAKKQVALERAAVVLAK